MAGNIAATFRVSVLVPRASHVGVLLKNYVLDILAARLDVVGIQNSANASPDSDHLDSPISRIIEKDIRDIRMPSWTACEKRRINTHGGFLWESTRTNVHGDFDKAASLFCT
jgi:hypothetical protein